MHRRPIELEHFIDLADQQRLALATVTGEVDLATHNGGLYARIKGAVTRSEMDQKRERLRLANAQRAAKGLPPVGPRARGWQADGMTVVEDEAELVRSGFATVLARVRCGPPPHG